MESTHSRNLNSRHLPATPLAFPVVSRLPSTEISRSSPGASPAVVPPQIVPNCYRLNYSVSKSDYRIAGTSVPPVFSAEVLDLSRNRPPSDERKDGAQVANLLNGSSRPEKKLAMDSNVILRMETNKLCDIVKGEEEEEEDFDDDGSDQKSSDELCQHSNPGRG